MNRRRFVGHVLALAATGYASGQKEFIGFDEDEVQGCSRILSTTVEHSNSLASGRKDRFFANLRSGRQVEISEKDFMYLFDRRMERRVKNAQQT